MDEFDLLGTGYPWDPRRDPPACESCGNPATPAYRCPCSVEITPAEADPVTCPHGVPTWESCGRCGW
jgi:hypothetical protein